MATPTRPTTGGAIELDWGQQVHDDTFAPKGVHVSGSDVTQLASAVQIKLPLDTAVDDPGGWLDNANDRLEVPADADGLYTYRIWIRTDEGASTDETRGYIRVNNVEVNRHTVGQEGSTAIPCVINGFLTLAEGDLVTFYASQVGSGTRATVGVVSAYLVRLGRELGA
jgi:hypothetical protein